MVLLLDDQTIYLISVYVLSVDVVGIVTSNHVLGSKQKTGSQWTVYCAVAMALLDYQGIHLIVCVLGRVESARCGVNYS